MPHHASGSAGPSTGVYRPSASIPHPPNSNNALLAQQRQALQSQLDAQAQDQAAEDIDLPDINSEYEYSDDEPDSDAESPVFKRPNWAESPELRDALRRQATRDPDELFGPIKPLVMEELFKVPKSKFRNRTSSGNWSKDGLTKVEEEEYARRMGFVSGPSGRQG